MNETKWATIATDGNFRVRRWAEVRMGSGAVRGNRIWSSECGATAFGVSILTQDINKKLIYIVRKIYQRHRKHIYKEDNQRSKRQSIQISYIRRILRHRLRFYTDIK